MITIVACCCVARKISLFLQCCGCFSILHSTHEHETYPKESPHDNIVHCARNKKKETKHGEPAHACWLICCFWHKRQTASWATNHSHPPSPPPRILTSHSTAIANLDELPDRERRRRSYLRERRWRRRHLSVWETQHIRPLPQRLPSAEQASILMYYTAAVSKETRPGHVTA